MGLPARAHCSDLAIASDGNGGTDLYLSTYGHSYARHYQAIRNFGSPTEVAESSLECLETVADLSAWENALSRFLPDPCSATSWSLSQSRLSWLDVGGVCSK